MTRKLGLVVLVAALCACSGELDAMTPGTPDSGVPDAGTPDSSVPQQRDDCTDGVDCHCDRFADPTDSLYEPTVLFCEDFENPSYDDGGYGWTEVYGPAASVCRTPKPDGSGTTAPTMEGTCERCCINVVQEGACDVSGENDCVFSGSQSLGHRMRPSERGGVPGSASFPVTRDFGITMALRYSPNYLAPGECASCGPAHKSNQFGGDNHSLLGSSSGEALSPRNGPFPGSVHFDQGAAPSFTRLLGEVGSRSGRLKFGPDRNIFDWSTSHGPGQWICIQVHYRNWGSSSGEVRLWVDGELATHVTNLDMRTVKDPLGIDGFAFNHYYNGAGNDEGYPGHASVAYRYEDNIVIVSGDEPVSCEAIGFTDDMLQGSR